MIGFVGLSHLGIVSSIATASKASERIMAFDPDAALCENLRKGKLPVSEPELSELLKASASRIEFTSEPSKLGACQIVYLSVDIPTDQENRSDLSVLNRLIETSCHFPI